MHSTSFSVACYMLAGVVVVFFLFFFFFKYKVSHLARAHGKALKDKLHISLVAKTSSKGNPAMDFLDPERVNGKQYQLLSRDDNILCPKSVERSLREISNLCRTAFCQTDKVILKSVGV
ncbi:unnamed protein product [Porites lobata]|uniref:ATP synthase F0 subunit 8 n=1 Tax=Porites lobata TaxID=104759 RepID=A0ABN8PCF6_9CNID|nr:unnamed protein product [Porites lobata]